MAIEYAPTLRQEYARRAFHWGDGERRSLEAMLRDSGERIYLRTILAELQRQGIELVPERIASVREAWMLQARDRVRDLAAEHARQITQTHNRLMSGAVDRIIEEHPTYNRFQIVGAMARLDDATMAWKSRQINETERAAFYGLAFDDFYQANSDLAALFDFGGSLQCPVCVDIADSNPYTYQAMQGIDYPPHPGCLDVWEPLG